MVLNPEVFDYLKDDTTVFEREPMERLAAEGQMKSFYHSGFWQCMDTQREMKSWRPYGSREMRPGNMEG